MAGQGDRMQFPGFSDFNMENARLDKDGHFEAAVLPLRDMVVYPNMVTPLYIGRERSLSAVEAALAAGETVIGLAQKDAEVIDPIATDLYRFGVEMALSRPMRLPDGGSSTLVQGRRRIEVLEFLQFAPYIRVKARLIEETPGKGKEAKALRRRVLESYERCVELNPNISEESYAYVLNISETGWLADAIASTLELRIEQRQEILETADALKRLHQIHSLLAQELDVLEIEDQIKEQVQQEVNRGQREMYLREQLRAIQTELGEIDIFQQELTELREKLESIGLPEEVYKKAQKELSRLSIMPQMSPEVGIIRSYLDWLADLPWSKATEDNLDIEHAATVLDAEHFGLPKAKERILEHLAVRKLALDKMKSPIICFVGPPGTGKTSLGRSIAKSLGREFVRVSLGGVRDEAEIRGHRRTYIGALPGRIIQTMRRAGTVNPVFMLDEIDKLGQDFRGDPSGALLEVLDPEQNNAYSDHYLEVSYDLSKVMFVTTANSLEPIPDALLDRLEVIEFTGYIEEEKLQIARQFLIPRKLSEHGLSNYEISFEEETLKNIIREYTYEAGVRNLERALATVCRKLARKVAADQPFKPVVRPEDLPIYLGPPEYLQDKVDDKEQVGLVTGMAWTEGGGDVLFIEVILMAGKGNISFTGSLGEIMQESAQAAHSYTRSRAKELGIKLAAFEKNDIHVHMPEGAIPKEGPSAGVSLATALISALTMRPVRSRLAMTGEITVRGKVLPVGGIKEKVMAAHRAGVREIILPERNRKDTVEIPQKILEAITIHYVADMEEVLNLALLPAPKVAPKPRPRKPRARPQSTAPASSIAGV